MTGSRHNATTMAVLQMGSLLLDSWTIGLQTTEVIMTP